MAWNLGNETNNCTLTMSQYIALKTAALESLARMEGRIADGCEHKEYWAEKVSQLMSALEALG